MRVAITSSNGNFVDQHFGKTTKLYVYDIKGGAFHLTSIREVEPFCGTREDDSTHTGIIELIEGRLEDCDTVVTARIGLNMRSMLLENGIVVFELPGLAADALDRLISGDHDHVKRQ